MATWPGANGPSGGRSPGPRPPPGAGFVIPGARKKDSNLTKLARKYGHPYRKLKGISHRLLKNTGKSGLTPLSPCLAHHLLDPGYGRQKLAWYYYQQRRFFSFTARELLDMDAYSSAFEGRFASNLTNPIHEMYERGRWDTERTLAKHIGFLPILEGPGKGGVWRADNDYVWNLLDVPLRLASLLLDNAAYWPW
jgi:hypothetical protein